MKALLTFVCLVLVSSCAHTKNTQRAEYVGTCNNVLYLAQEAMVEAQSATKYNTDTIQLITMHVDFGTEHKCINRDEVLFTVTILFVFSVDSGEKICGTSEWLVYSKLEDGKVSFEIVDEYNESLNLCG